MGTIEFDRYDAYIIPDDRKIAEDMLVLPQDTMGAKLGDKVVAEILSYPDGRRPMIGRVIEVLGSRRDAGTDVLSIVRQYDLEEEFGKAALELAARCEAPNETTIARRLDLRGELIITIDGEDAKDLDDAVSLTRLANGNYRLGVHIADVSHYVKRGTALDREAKQRATSVYLLDRVLPMLPKEISNGVCSLNAGEDKLTLSCIMEVTPEGRVKKHRLVESVIRSAHRMTYTDVNAILGGDAALCETYADILPMLREMDALREALYAKRVKRGCIDFDLDEAKITLDENGIPTDVRAAERGNAERLIEEFMLLANETVAQHLAEKQLPCLYRVHETPDREKLETLRDFLQSLGFAAPDIREIQPRVLQAVLHEAKDTPEENIIGRVTLRSLKKARYSEQNLGHFGLAAEYYCHFTSPIRRYPDLTVHRTVKQMLHGKLGAQAEKLTAQMPDLANHCSERERVAMEAERAVDDLKKCQYMLSHIGEEETGIISGMTGFGFFVELPNTVEGVVRLSTLTDDHYIWEEKAYRVVGRGTKRVYRLGDTVRVKVASVNMEMRLVEFEVVHTRGEERPIARDAGKKAPKKASAKRPEKAGKKPPEKKGKKPSAKGKSKGKHKGNSKGKRKSPHAKTH
ncbi:MAG: ribonuclease R [Clostridia bacterium]|nr:ribonuclease R [Clostridia bacterium]